MKEKMMKRVEGNNRIEPDGRIREIMFLMSLAAISMAVFLLAGADSYILFDDSGSYLNMERYVEGVMPLYPLFLRMNRILFGEAVYLQAVVVEQAVFACACLIVFTNLVRRQFGLGFPESYVIFFLSFLPFTTDMPVAMTTQEIVTEGIAYAAFYLFMAVVLKAVWEKRIRYIIILFLITLLLAATRSQLQILFGICGIIFFYVALAGKWGNGRENGNSGRRLLLRLLTGAAGCLVIGLVGVWCTSRISIVYQQELARYTRRLESSKGSVENAESASGDMEKGTETAEDNSPSAEAAEDNGSEREVEQAAVAGQYTSLIFSRGMYEAEYEDYQLFEDEGLQELYLYLYEAADRAECRYIYARPGLWMWKDIVGGIGSVGVECFYAQNEYYRSRPEIAQSREYANIRNANQMTIGITLIKAHLGRLLYHTVMLLPQAFICTVFFQIARFYLLCHIITLILYLSAIALMIWAYADKKAERAYAEFMSAVLGTNLLMILVISFVFFGQQRYLVYDFGIFYMAYFLLLLQWWKLYGKNWLMKWIDRRKS